jgi:carbamoylphosphate synthase small subunit
MEGHDNNDDAVAVPSPSPSSRQQPQLLDHRTRPQIVILDFGSQYTHLIARRVREMNVYSELHSCRITSEELTRINVVGVILSGGPSSVYEDGAPHVDGGIWRILKERGVPVLGICYGMQVREHSLRILLSPNKTKRGGRGRREGEGLIRSLGVSPRGATNDRRRRQGREEAG